MAVNPCFCLPARLPVWQQAEEERRKLAMWDEEMEEVEAEEAEKEERERERRKKKMAGVVAEEGNGGKEEGESLESEVEKEEEKNEVLKAARQFMRSGAKVRRANKGKVC